MTNLFMYEKLEKEGIPFEGKISEKQFDKIMQKVQERQENGEVINAEEFNEMLWEFKEEESKMEKEKLDFTVAGKGTFEEAQKDLLERLMLISSEFTKDTALSPFTVEIEDTGYTTYTNTVYGMTFTIIVPNDKNDNNYGLWIFEN